MVPPVTEVVQVTGALVMVLPQPSATEAANCCVVPAGTLTLIGVTATAAGSPAMTVTPVLEVSAPAVAVASLYAGSIDGEMA